MDQFSFIFPLLLIVSVTTTTLGSAIKTKNPNGEEADELRSDLELSLHPDEMALSDKEVEALLSDAGLGSNPETAPNRQDLEALLKRFNHSNPSIEKDTAAKMQGEKGLRHQDSEKFKRVSLTPGEVIQAAELTLSALNALAAGESYSRAVVIGIDNESGFKWEAIKVHFYHGTSDVVLPQSVTSGNALVYDARKRWWSFYGVSGVLAYCLPNIKKTLAVMFSVPYSGFYSNWFNVKLYDGRKTPDNDLFNEMYKDHPLEGSNTWHDRSLDVENLKFSGYMTSSDKATIKIKLHDC